MKITFNLQFVLLSVVMLTSAFLQAQSLSRFKELAEEAFKRGSGERFLGQFSIAAYEVIATGLSISLDKLRAITKLRIITRNPGQKSQKTKEIFSKQASVILRPTDLQKRFKPFLSPQRKRSIEKRVFYT